MYIRAPGPHSNANQESDLFRNQFGPLAQVAVGLGEMFWVIKGKWCLWVSLARTATSPSDPSPRFRARAENGFLTWGKIWPLNSHCSGFISNMKKSIHWCLKCKKFYIPALISKLLAYGARIDIQSECLRCFWLVELDWEICGISKGIIGKRMELAYEEIRNIFILPHLTVRSGPLSILRLNTRTDNLI